jgi:hypothetical protein
LSEGRDIINLMAQFEQLAKDQKPASIVSEFLDFLAHSKKWWLLPIVVVMVLFGVLLILAGTGAAPFIYTLF